MAAKCEICEKKPEFGHNVSHAQNKTNRRWNPNIQSVKTIINGTSKKINVCTSCIKAGKIQKKA